MTLFRVLVILLLVGAILGGSAYYSYELFWKPELPPPEELEPPPPPPPSPSEAAYEKARALEAKGDRTAERAALTDFLSRFPDSPQAAEAAARLGTLNARRVFSPGPDDDWIPYEVEKGDSLVRIASKFGTNAELIYRVNNLETINLQIGQELRIPKLEMSMVVDRKAGTITLLDGGEFFKSYPILSGATGRSRSPGATKVTDKLALQGADRVAFGSKNFVGSDRWIMLGRPGLVIRAQLEEGEGAPRAGILVSPSDIEEIFLLVSRNVPVTIK